MRVYVFGNEHLADDCMAAKVAEHLRGAEVVHCRSPEELLDAPEQELVILDVVKNTKRAALITDIRRLKSRNLTSLHDFDLGYFLTLTKELGMEKRVRIIGLPSEGDPQALAAEVQPWIA